MAKQTYGSPKVLKGDGITVVTLRVGPADNEEYLVQLRRNTRPLGPVRKHVRVNNGRDFIEWQTEKGGSVYRTIIEREREGPNRHEVWLPGKRLGITVRLDKQATENFEPEQLIKNWQ